MAYQAMMTREDGLPIPPRNRSSGIREPPPAHTRNDNKFRDLNGETGHDIIERHKRDYGVDLNEMNVFEDPIPYLRFFLDRLKATQNVMDSRLYASFIVQYGSNNWCMDKLRRIEGAYDILAEKALWFEEKKMKTGVGGLCAFAFNKPVPGTPFAEYGYMTDPTVKWEKPEGYDLYPPAEPLPDKFPLYETYSTDMSNAVPLKPHWIETMERHQRKMEKMEKEKEEKEAARAAAKEAAASK